MVTPNGMEAPLTTTAAKGGARSVTDKLTLTWPAPSVPHFPLRPNLLGEQRQGGPLPRTALALPLRAGERGHALVQLLSSWVCRYLSACRLARHWGCAGGEG